MSQNGELAASIAAARAAASASLTVLADGDLCDRAGEIEELGRIVDGLRLGVAGELDARYHLGDGAESLGRRTGFRTAASLLEGITRVSGREAGRRVRLAGQVAERQGISGAPVPARFPFLADAVKDGQIGVDAAQVIATMLSQAAPRASAVDLDAAEEQLTLAAVSEPADMVAVQAGLWRAALDPDGAVPREEELRRKRSFTIGRELDGMTPFRGVADPETAEFLRSAIGERLSPRREPRFTDAPNGTDDGGVGDERTRDQKAFDTLIGLLRAGIRGENESGPLHPTATVNVTVTLEELTTGRGHAWLDGVGEAISAATAQRIACDAGYRLHIMGQHGEILWHGRKHRSFTPAQRRAIAVRDGGCIIPGCTAPPSWCDVHHPIGWANGGPTDVDNGVPACVFHHHLIHSGVYHVRIRNGCPEVLLPLWLDPHQRWRPAGRTALRNRIPVG